MKEMTLDEIHAVNLIVLKEIDRFCREKNIRYGLAYGTLIGAIRHKGFIPWDDDSDIVMPREDYDRFVKEYVDSDKFRLYAPEKHNSWLPYGRLCEMKDTFFGQKSPWTKEKPGIGVDIFPMEDTYDDPQMHAKIINKFCELRSATLRARYTHVIMPDRDIPSIRKTLIENFKCLCRIIIRGPKRVIKSLFADKISNETIYNFLSAINNHSITNSSYCSNLRCVVYTDKERIKKDWIQTYKPTEFCGEELMIPVASHEILTNYYGDYMKLPPESDRRVHTKNQIMYWRDK